MEPTIRADKAVHLASSKDAEKSGGPHSAAIRASKTVWGKFALVRRSREKVTLNPV